MIPIRKLGRVALVLAVAVSLAGCISLFPKAKPAQLYRFDGRGVLAAQPPAAGGATGVRAGIVRAGGSFQAAASGDRILTVTGTQVAYLAGSRWSGPAQTLFDEALVGAFEANKGPARMVARGEPARAIYTLRLDVSRFEAEYDRGPRSAPKVLIEMHAELIRAADRTVVGDRMFRTEVRAGDDRVGAIVEAYDQAVGRVLSDLVAWTNETARPIA